MTGEELRVLENLIDGLLFATTVVAIAFSPVARALGKRIMHGRIPAPGAPQVDEGRVDHLSDEVAAMRQHLDETLDRIEFTERMLAQARERGALGPAKDG
jgi:hypothetical protein